MSGHSKWATIKRKKGAADAKRGKIFTKLIREIATAARLGGGDLDANPRLRLAVDKARGANMPKDNIERAIRKGAGGASNEAYEEVVYEGYGPGGAAVLVETLTDNRNRTAGEVRHVFGKFGGNLGSSGCVSYLFESRGVLVFEPAQGGVSDALLEAALEAGADDVVEGDGSLQVLTSPAAFEGVRRALVQAGFEAAHAALERHPATTVELSGEVAQSMLELVDALDELDDVQTVSANFEIPDEELARIGA